MIYGLPALFPLLCTSKYNWWTKRKSLFLQQEGSKFQPSYEITEWSWARFTAVTSVHTCGLYNLLLFYFLLARHGFLCCSWEHLQDTQERSQHKKKSFLVKTRGLIQGLYYWDPGALFSLPLLQFDKGENCFSILFCASLLPLLMARGWYCSYMLPPLLMLCHRVLLFLKISM